MKIAGVIPARYKSSRFPGKPLAMIAGVPMIIRVARKTEEALGRENTYIATDDERIAALAAEYGYQAVMTSDTCKTGTDRLAEFSQTIAADIYINIQGDEPIINPKDILKIVEAKKANYNKVINAMSNLLAGEDPANINIPKVVTGRDGRLLYMSRLPVPGIKDSAAGIPVYKKQICIYAFNKTELDIYASYTSKAETEKFEDIEILRFLDAGRDVLMIDTESDSIAVDVPDDILLVEKKLLGESRR